MKKLFVLLFCFVLMGCLGGRSQPAHFYTLQVVAPQTTFTTFSGSIVLSQVQLPKYLDRPQIVVVDEENQVLVLEKERWVEPLSNLMGRTLVADLSGQLPKAIIKQRTLSNEKFDYFLSLDITDIKIELDHHLTMKGWWIVRNQKGRVILRNKINLTAPLLDEYEDIALVQSQVLSQLATQISKKLAKGI